MANILDRYGIKEVADVTFYELEGEGEVGAPVLYLDTLKVSTIEQTAENTSARGGKGNPELIMWDYGKEITVTLEDALFSAKSMAMMYGVKTTDKQDFANAEYVLKTVTRLSNQYNDTDKTITINGDTFKVYKDAEGKEAGVKFYDADGNEGKAPDGMESPWEEVTVENYEFATGYIKVSGQQIVISSDKFPGNYYVTGDTYARSEATGKDEFFQFIIPKAKMQSEVTLTMEAEGDPSTFSMNLKVLRPADGDMMKLVKYSVEGNG